MNITQSKDHNVTANYVKWMQSELQKHLKQNWGTFKWIWKLIKATLKQNQSKLGADLKQIGEYERRKRIYYSNKFHLISFCFI